MAEKHKIFIGGLHLETENEGLISHFNQYGEVLDAIVMRNGATGLSRGFGFVTFAEKDSLEKCLSEQHHEIDGRTVECKIAVSKDSMNRGPSASVRKEKKVFLGGLSPETKKEDVKQALLAILPEDLSFDIDIKTDKETEKPRGFGFCTIQAPADKDDDYAYEAVDKLVQKNYIKILDRNVEVKVAKPAEEMRRNEPKISTGPYGGGNRDRSMYSAGGGYSYPDMRAAAYASYGYGGGGAMDYYSRSREYMGYPPAAMGYDRSRGGGYSTAGYDMSNPYNYMMGSYSQTSSGYGPTRGYGDTADRSRDAARLSYHPYTRTAYK